MERRNANGRIKGLPLETIQMKMCLKLSSQLLRFVFEYMEWISRFSIDRHCVICIWRRQNKRSGGTHNAPQFCQKLGPSVQVFESLERRHYIEAFIGKRQSQT